MKDLLWNDHLEMIVYKGTYKPFTFQIHQHKRNVMLIKSNYTISLLHINISCLTHTDTHIIGPVVYKIGVI